MNIAEKVESYIELLEKVGYEPNPLPSNPSRLMHVLWMLYEIRDNVDKPYDDKLRWFGYVQGVLSFKGTIREGLEVQ